MTQPKEIDGVSPIEIYTIVGPEKDPVQEQDSKNEDDEFHRIEYEQKLKLGG
jgi:ABC-type tungstate transport system permease subunit